MFVSILRLTMLMGAQRPNPRITVAPRDSGVKNFFMRNYPFV